MSLLKSYEQLSIALTYKDFTMAQGLGRILIKTFRETDTMQSRELQEEQRELHAAKKPNIKYDIKTSPEHGKPRKSARRELATSNHAKQRLESMLRQTGKHRQQDIPTAKPSAPKPLSAETKAKRKAALIEGRKAISSRVKARQSLCERYISAVVN